MKILQINTVYGIASTGRSMAELHEYLQSKGHLSYIAAVNIKHTDYSFRIGSIFENYVHSFFSRLMGKQGYYSNRTTNELLKFIRSKKPDVVHLRVLHSNCLNIYKLLKFLGEHNYPVVISLHDCWFFTGHCCYFTEAGCYKWKKACGYCPEIHKWNKSWFFDRSSQNLALKKQLFDGIKRLAVVGVSDWVTDFVQDSILRKATIIRRIYNWIDLEKFKPVDCSLVRKRLGVGDCFVVICIAQNWSALKGLDDIISLAKRLPNYKFLMVGKCPKEYYPLPQNIIAVGSTKNIDELVEYYSVADVFFNPSLQETFGKVTAESLSCGTPVVAYGVTATIELVKPGCGFLISPHNLDDAVIKLKKIEYDGKESYSANCRTFAVQNFKKEVLAQETLNLYKELINS